MSASAADRIHHAEIFQETWKGVSTKLQQLFSLQSQVTGTNVAVVPSASPDNFEAELLQKGVPLELPVIVVTPTAVEPNLGSYNAHVMRRDGMKMQINEGREWYAFVKATPCVLTFQVMLVTDDGVTMLRMLERWVTNETWGFVLNFADFRVRVRVVADKNVAVPTRTPAASGAEQFRLVTNLRVETFAGYVWLVPSVRSVELRALFPLSTIAHALETGVTDGVPVLDRMVVGPLPDNVPEFQPTF